MRHSSLVAIVALVLPAAAQAQAALTLPKGAVSMVAASADHRVDTGLGLERSAGPLFGAQLDLEPDERVTVTLRALGGTLNPQTRAAETRAVGELALTARLDMVSWFRGTVAALGRSYQGPLARQHWSELSLGGEGHGMLIDNMLEGSVGLALAPAVRVSGRSGPDLAIAGLARLRHSGERLDLSLGYSLERYDFAGRGGGRRVEEISMLVFRAGLRIGTRRNR
ncbi:MAG TPA: hypothetical protein VG432_02375 [Gemmatimonadaceae bacterium]|nr:hypothetical protein [Gemmatimonadaceae bacterium]